MLVEVEDNNNKITGIVFLKIFFLIEIFFFFFTTPGTHIYFELHVYTVIPSIFYYYLLLFSILFCLLVIKRGTYIVYLYFTCCLYV